MDALEFLTWRRKRGFSQAALAGQMGIAVSTISRWERGITAIPVSAEKYLEFLAGPSPKPFPGLVEPQVKPRPHSQYFMTKGFETAVAMGRVTRLDKTTGEHVKMTLADLEQKRREWRAKDRAARRAKEKEP